MQLNSGALTDTVLVSRRTGRGGAGVSYGPPVPVRVLLSTTYRLVRTPDAEQTPVDVLMFARPDTAWAFGDKVTLPDGREVTVQTVTDVKWGRRVSHIEVAAG